MVAIRTFFLALIVWAAILAAVWLLPAGLLPDGTWRWRRGLWAVGLISVLQAIGAAYFAANMPAKEKQHEQRAEVNSTQRSGWRDPLVDLVGVAYGVAFLVFIPLDVFYFHLLPRPSIAISTAGGIVSILGVILMHASVAQHVATPRMRDSGKDPAIIDTGLYGVVRHPMYLGALLWLFGAALWLESYAAVIACLGCFVFLLVRIAIEETYLRANLPAYPEYCRRVRCRLLPFVL